jgi:pimeloyl-ACP methyl ester carboxylesterase
LRPRERSVAVADTELFLREWEADGPPVLFWHALGDHTSLQMVEAGPILAERFGYRVLAVDAPGFGGSPRLPDERYEVPALIELARSLFDALGLERIPWIGSSWGATLGIHFAGKYPDLVSGLVLLDGGYLDPRGGDGKTLEELREHWRSQPGFRYETWDALFEDARQYFKRWSPEMEEYVRSAYEERNDEVVSKMGPDVYAAAIYGVDTSPPSAAQQRLGEARVPVLLLTATEPPEDEERRLASIAQFAARVPQADIRRVDRAPHFLLESRPGEIARTVGGWLQAVPYA